CNGPLDIVCQEIYTCRSSRPTARERGRQMATKVILDVDTGTDDAVALMLAALHPDLELVGACSVTGNVPLDFTTENTLRVFDHINRPIPVYRGLGKPLSREDFPVPRDA